MNDITIFTYDNTNIRTITTEDGTPLFCGKDIASILGYTNTNKAIQDHCKGVTIRYPPLRLRVESRKHASSPKATSTG